MRNEEAIRGIQKAALSVAEDRDISPRGGESLIPGLGYFFIFSTTAAWAAASRAMGTRKGEQLT